MDLQEMVAETARVMAVRPADGGFEGEAPDWFRGATLFGGFLLGQAVYAAGLTAPADRRIHSLHAYFLRPAVPGPALLHEVEQVRDGRAFAVRRLKTWQAGKVVFEMACSYTAAGEDIDYGEPLASEIPDPEGEPRLPGWGGPYHIVRVGPGGGESSRAWFKIAGSLPDDPLVHDAVVAMMTDMTASGGEPIPGRSSRHWVSLDHAVWFHRRLRADQWMHYGVHTLVNAGGRAVMRGTMHGPDRHISLSMAQEALLPARDQPAG